MRLIGAAAATGVALSAMILEGAAGAVSAAPQAPAVHRATTIQGHQRVPLPCKIVKTNKVVKVFKFGHWQLVITQVKKIVCSPIHTPTPPPSPPPLQHRGADCAHIEWVNGQKVCFPTLGGGT
ncbi:hypothetical protein [Streptomyces sp. NBC_00009]|uniref:hypothetical protein n=1 Tax=Streptomyces sp. NBC_00009 TaxID=2975620 RepID=UPI00324C577B